MFKTRVLDDSYTPKKTEENNNELEQSLLEEHHETQIHKYDLHQQIQSRGTEHELHTQEYDTEEQEKRLKQLKLQTEETHEYPGQQHLQHQQQEYPKQKQQHPEQQPQQKYFSGKERSGIIEKTKQRIRSLPLQQYNILLFGETGSGKSTLINYFTNFFLGGSLHNLKIAIPTKHHQATEGWAYSEKDLHDETKSKTSECTTYTFTTDVACYNFIDTPGLSDTEGTTKDDEHIMKIMASAESKGTLAALIIVINGTVARATVNLRNTLTLLKSSVPDVLLKNLMVILTNCSKSTVNFDLKQLHPWKVPKDNVFHMNNSAFAKSVHEWKNDEEMMDDLEDHWKKSMKVIQKMMQTIRKLGSKTTSAFKDMRLKRNKIKSELHGILLEVKKLQNMQDQLICATTAEKDVSSDIQKYENYKRQKQVDYMELADANYHSTICMTHTTCCHENCGLSYTTAQGDEVFKGCACMRGSKNCTVCECDHSTHYHDKKKPVKKTKTVDEIMHDVKALYDQHTDKKAQLQKTISTLTSDIDSLKRALDTKEAGIKKCCEELKTLCSYFNFVDELESVIDTMERDARTLTNMKARQDAQTRINNIVHIANQLSTSK